MLTVTKYSRVTKISMKGIATEANRFNFEEEVVFVF